MMLADTDFSKKSVVLGKDFVNFLVTQLIVDNHLGMKLACGVVLT